MSKKIYVEPRTLQDASKKIDGLAGEYEQQYKLLYNEVGEMGAAWKGADNTAFVQQIEGFQEDFKQMTDMLRNYARFLRESAEKYSTTQTDIVNYAKQLTN